jgi:hypothetical protein
MIFNGVQAGWGWRAQLNLYHWNEDIGIGHLNEGAV